ncbi:MAG TPA: trehalose-phosphatase [Candidatus Saccharimonadales bacterium]|nr:trehalose-phosphatase [Candidatus Saccharimonadales bacterium]
MDSKTRQAYKNAKKRLFLLDYDGTLAELKLTPPEAKPTSEILSLLQALAADQYNTVVIISGRKHQEMEDWLGMLPISLVAEQGLLIKHPEQDWQRTRSIDISWKAEIRSLMNEYTRQAPGSFVEEKTAALVWHWRNAAEHQKADKLGASLRAELESLCPERELKLVPGKDVLEVQPQGYNKGDAAKYWIAQDNWEWILSAGDDITDEDMFAALPDWACTIKIGEGKSVAAIQLKSPGELRAALAVLP